MLILSGDIRDQSRKFSKIVQNFGRFFGRHKFLGARTVKIVPTLSPLPRGTSTEKKSREDTATSPEVIDLKTLNFRPNFKFSRSQFSFFWGGGPHPTLGCALARLGQSLARVKISGRSTP